MTTENTKIPAGFVQDAHGNLISKANVKEIDLLRDEVVTDLMKSALVQAQDNHKFRNDSLDNVSAFVETSAMDYGKDLGGDKGNVSLTSYDGRFKVQRVNQDQQEFDERLLVAKKLIDECLKDWTQKSGQELKALVADAFKTNAAGQVSTGRIMGLRKFKFTDDRWKQAMEAIGDSIKVNSVKTYIRFYVRDEKTGKYELLPMDGSIDPKSLFPDSE